MLRARHLILLAGVVLGCLVAPTVAGAQATDPNPARIMVERSYSPSPAVTSVGGQTGFRVLSAIDLAGIESVWLKVDGVLAARVPMPCASDYAIDCENLSSPVLLPLDTTILTEASHTFTVGVVDGAGYSTTGLTRVLRVDNTAPGAPVPLTPQQINTSAARVDIRWHVPGEVLAASAATICDVTGCRPLSHPMAPTALQLPVQFGVTTLTVWVRDEAGNGNPAQTTTWTINRTRAPIGTRVDPGLSITVAKVGRDRRTVTVGGLLKVPHTNKVSVSVRAKIGRRTKTVRAIAVTSGHGFRTELKLPSSKWRVATVTARVAGTSRYLTVERTKTVRRG
ncbi:MAG: hypothetical protein QOG77_2983 [Solirubrobacteraceae bacterium]|nr:hypothetical protein [Solirubrobacteraceae bacterium]